MQGKKDVEEKRKIIKDRRRIKNEEGIRRIWDRRVKDWDRRAADAETAKKI